jgi:hypothetical protein
MRQMHTENATLSHTHIKHASYALHSFAAHSEYMPADTRMHTHTQDTRMHTHTGSLRAQQPIRHLRLWRRAQGRARDNSRRQLLLLDARGRNAAICADCQE